MTDSAQLWADPRLVYAVATLAVTLLLATLWLFNRRHRQGRQAGVICLILSIGLHAALLFLVPMLPAFRGGSPSVAPEKAPEVGVDSVSFAAFDSEPDFADAAGKSHVSAVAPLPVSELLDVTDQPVAPEESDVRPPPQTDPPSTADIPQLLATQPPIESALVESALIDTAFDELLEQAFDNPTSMAIPEQAVAQVIPKPSPPAVEAAHRTVPGETQNDFANRTGQAKQAAIANTGGDLDTERAVEAALRFLTAAQRTDGAWDPRASGAGVERSPLGLNRGGAGARAESAITGLALLALQGAGHSHRQGDYADHVYRGLVYLMRIQKPDGSLSGGASVYASTYSHGMAALAVCEAAAITEDPSAVKVATRAIAHTRRMQHPSTGGWRYLQGDPGDLSQLGWQAMVLDAGFRAKIPIDHRMVNGINQFLRSVRMGRQGGLASYRPGERPSPTMTAEALATRLLMGEQVPADEIAEAEQYLMENLPGTGKDNYYYWYYATLALHQLQDDAWERWNAALKSRLLATQRSDGSWSADTLWGGYGGTIYTTSMATLCLETYYRHAIRTNRDRLANQPNQDANFR